MGQKLDLSGYKLTFDDEFNHFSWNGGGERGVWSTTYSYGERKLNDEIQTYSDRTIGVDPFSIENGALVITAAPSTDLGQSWGRPYTSGVITSYRTFSQQYGYFETRAKLPSGQGLWPAFWLLPVEHVWPPEIDVFEAFGSEPYQLHWAAHTSTSLGNAGNWVGLPADATRGFHRYGVAWTAETLTYFFDGEAVAQTATPEDHHQPMYMIANLAIGGQWAGNPTPGTVFPAKLEIDYIRAFSAAAEAVEIVGQAVSAPDLGLAEAAAAPRAGPPRRSGEPSVWIDRDKRAGTAGNDRFQTYYGDTATRAGGLGDDTYVLTDSRMHIDERAGEGTDLVLSWMNYTLPAQVENISIAASWGLRATGNAVSNYVTGNAGDDTLSGGTGGDDVLTGAGGRDTFIVAAGTGRDTITDFQPGDGEAHDTLLLEGFSFTSAAAVVAALRSSGADVTLPFSNGEWLTFWNADRMAFKPENFLFGAVTEPPPAPAASVRVAASQTLTLYVSQDAYLGDAQFTVAIDGRQIGGVNTARAAHGAGETEAFSFSMPFGDGPYDVSVRLVNDAYGGPGNDRNLYVDGYGFAGERRDAGMALYNETAKTLRVGANPAMAYFTDVATGASGANDLEVYGGPVDYLQWQALMPGDGGMAVATERSDVYVLTGAGDDAIQAHGGRNVLDGGGGSNFLVGGRGDDTFFVDARGDATVWDTIVNFNAGDTLTFWGFGAGDSFAFDAAESGAAGYEGATLRAQIGSLLQSVTFAGLSVEAATRLATSMGSAGGLDYLMVQAA